MAQRYNPLTKAWEDDGIGVDVPGMPGAPPPAGGPPPLDMAGAGGPGAPPPPAAPAPAAPVVPSLFPPKPEHETTVESRAPSAGTLAADKAVTAGGAGVLAAQDKVGQVAVGEARAGQQAADEQAAERARRKDEAAQEEAARKEVIRQHQAEDAADIEAARRDKEAAGGARKNYWKGNPSGEVMAAILQGVSQAASSFLGQGGPSPVERIVQRKIDDHERALVAKWEATKEAAALRKGDRQAYEAELDRQRIAAANQSQAQLGIIEDQLKSSLAALGPEKAKAALELLQATKKETDARLQQSNAEKYDNIIKTTNRSPAGGAGGKTSGTEERAAGDLGAMISTLEEIKAGTKLTPKAVERYTENKEKLQATSGPRGFGGVVSNQIGRAVGYLPTGEMDGVPQPQQNTIRAVETLKAKMQQMISGAGVSNEENERLNGLYGVRLGDNPKAIAEKLSGLARELREKTVEAGPRAGALQERLDRVTGKGAAPAPKSDAGGARGEYQQLIDKARAAGDQATVDALTREMAGLK